MTRAVRGLGGRLDAAWAPMNTRLRYAQTREQFGKPIASFQLVQDLLAKMIGNVTASQCMVVRLAELQDQGKLLDQHASLAKAFCTTRMRETVAWAREVLGGNGILLDHQVARYFADAEALYSYEGTREMNALIVGKAIYRLQRIRMQLETDRPDQSQSEDGFQ